MLIYRILRNHVKLHVKILHALIQVLTFVFTTVALKAVFDSHNKAAKPIPNMYSMHSWVGLAAVILFGMQWVCGFVAFLFPNLAQPFAACTCRITSSGALLYLECACALL